MAAVLDSLHAGISGLGNHSIGSGDLDYPHSHSTDGVTAPGSLEPHTHVHDLENHIHATDSTSSRLCAYCGLSDNELVVRCGTCDRWFCNGGLSSAGSHIITHLVLSRHSVVCLPPELPLGAETLECYNCGTRNIFTLGFVAAKHDSVVVILCRTPCAQLRDINWDTNAWQPLVEERRLVTWIAPVPDAEATMNTRIVTHEQLVKVEAQWRMNRDACVDDITPDAEAAELAPVLLRYPDAVRYQNVWAPLVAAEAECDKNLKEQQALEHISVMWGVTKKRRITALFALAAHDAAAVVVGVGDEVKLHLRTSSAATWLGTGTVVRVPLARSEMYMLELEPNCDPPPTDVTVGFTAEVVWRGVSYERMQKALRRFAVLEECVSGHVFHRMLGHEVEAVQFAGVPSNLAVPGLSTLNTSQLHAVGSALKQPLTLIQGPPGTGKTATCSAIVYHLTRMHKHQILVCAPLNVAVDHLAAKLDAIGVRVVRLVAKLREDAEAQALPFLVHLKVMKSALKPLRKLMEENETGTLTAAKSKAMYLQLNKLETSIIAAAQVVCCTCVGAGDHRLQKFRFRTVVIDESTQASEPEAMVALTRGAKQIVLVGDHQQLGPVILDVHAGQAGLRQLLFERLLCLGEVPIRLEVQYRMHPALAEFSSNMFYEGLLQNGVAAEERRWPGLRFPWPVPDCPMMFWANYGKEELSATGKSYLNRVEAMNVEKVVTRLFSDGVRPDQIGVITPYEGQRAYIVQHMQTASLLAERRADYDDVEVASVDAFQGREKDYIILLCVRASDERGIGFLRDPRRMNVALTRAKYGMVVLGNPRALSKNRLWNHLLTHYRERGCLVEGPLDALQLLMVPLGKTLAKLDIRASARAFDTRLVVLVDEYVLTQTATEIDESKWPALTSNEAARLDESTDEGVRGRDAQNVAESTAKNAADPDGIFGGDIDLRSIANAFASGLNL